MRGKRKEPLGIARLISEELSTAVDDAVAVYVQRQEAATQPVRSAKPLTSRSK
jgi:hypothetical protein